MVHPYIAFGAGIVSVLSPCVLPLVPIIMVGSIGSHRFRPLAIVLGMITSFTLLGIIAGAFGAMIQPFLELLKILAIFFIIFMGVFLLYDKMEMYLFQIMNRFKISMPAGGGFGGKKNESLFGAFFIGLSLGIVWIPCVGPILGVILTMVAVEGDIFNGGFLLFIYSLGLAVPMLILAYGTQTSAKKLQNVTKGGVVIRRILGIILILAGLTFLFGWDRAIQSALLPYFPEVDLFRGDY